MALSSKLRADYIELINGALDNITVEKLEDFDAIITCLNSILTPEEGYITRQDLGSSK